MKASHVLMESFTSISLTITNITDYPITLSLKCLTEYKENESGEITLNLNPNGSNNMNLKCKITEIMRNVTFKVTNMEKYMKKYRNK